MSTFHPTVTSFRQGARTMPAERYLSADVLAREAERLHARMWTCVGRSDRVPNPGDYVLCAVAGESLIVLRDRNGQLRAFFNVCRHRGTRICQETSGHLSETIQCPYHAWTYTLDGRLIGAPHMQEVEGFRKDDYPLHQAGIAEWEGFVFVNIAVDPVPFAEAWAPMIGRLARYRLSGLKVGHRVSYNVAANWKLVFQNYSECLHCPLIHPELNRKLPFTSGNNDLIEGSFLGGYMELTPPNLSATMSGKAVGALVNPDLPEEDRRRAFYYTLMPNLMLSIHPDYVNYYLVTAITPELTRVDSEWLFHPDSLADPDANLQDAIEFWDVTNRQDWDIVERSHQGITSRRYQPGPYSARESIPAAWDREYLRLMAAM